MRSGNERGAQEWATTAPAESGYKPGYNRVFRRLLTAFPHVRGLVVANQGLEPNPVIRVVERRLVVSGTDTVVHH
jgi:hypothetical protein